MHLIDYSLVVVYLVVLLVLGLIKSTRKDESAAELILGGRVLTMPGFVMSLVSTWYGGILGVGEYSYRFGLSNWLVFGLPYYLAALLFAFYLAKRARESQLLTIPDQLAKCYDRKTALTGSIIIYFMTVPAAYILGIGTLVQYLFGWQFWQGILAGTIFSVVYVYTGGFKSVVRTDLFQFVLMFFGFAVLLVLLVWKFGGLSYLTSHVPSALFTWDGGNSRWYIVSWYFIALATLIEPAFYQRCYAARDIKVARNGILISIGFWVLFDFMTTFCGLYARALLPELSNPVGSYPALAVQVLPPGLLGLFALALLATVMSTIDSYAFIAASTFSRDILMRLFPIPEKRIAFYTRIGLVVTTLIAVLLVLNFRSIVEIWYVFGTIGTPALLVPVFFSFVGNRRLPARVAMTSIILCGAVALVWYLSQHWTADGAYWLGLQPIFPGLALSLALYLGFAKKAANASGVMQAE